MTPSPSSPRIAAVRVPGIRLSDRLLQRLRRVVAGRPYFSGSVVMHGLLALLLLNLSGLGTRQDARVAAAESNKAMRRIEATQARDLRHRVDRMQAIRQELEPGAAPLPPGTGEGSPEALAERAQALADAIEAADGARRAQDLARLADIPLAEARRKVAAEDAARRLPPPPETAGQKIARLERHARDLAEARRARLDAQREGLRVTRAHAKTHRLHEPDAARAPTAPASGSTGQAHVADGIPRSMSEQFKSMLRLGGPQGRVGVVGTEAGRSVNREHVQGLAGGRDAKAEDFGRDTDVAGQRGQGVLEGQRERNEQGGGIGDQGSGSSKQGGAGAPDDVASARGRAAVRIPGSSLDLTGHAEDPQHTFVRYASPPAVDVAALHTAAGRVFGAGGTHAERVYLDTWYLIGPFAGKGQESQQAGYPPEDDVDLDAAYAGPEGRTLTWRFTSRGFYPFVPPDRRMDAVYYAYTEIRIDADRDVWFSLAADDDSMMWLDERLVWVSSPGDKPWYHPPYYARDERVGSLSLTEGRRRVHLSAGVHRLLFKLCNADGHPFFSVVLSN
ncbi:MAG: hypothetical protein ACJ8IK_11820 [Burkholderiaceae bacterium]